MLAVRKESALASSGILASAVFFLAAAPIARGQGNASFSSTIQSVSMRHGTIPSDIDEALWWLPEDTETVVVSKGNVPIKRLEPSQPPAGKSGSPSFTLPPQYVYAKYDYQYQDLVAMRLH